MSIMKRLSQVLVGATLAFGVAMTGGCEGSSGVESDELTGAPEDVNGEELTGSVTVGAKVRTTSDVNLRSGPGTGFKVLRVVPKSSLVVTVKGTPSKSFYQVKHNGLTGWIHGSYLSLVDEGDGDGDEGTTSSNTGGTPASSTRDNAINRAKSGVGFSYWWGHGRWRPEGPTSSTKGSCSGSCPNCSHKGSYGADCSGYVAKVWQVPSSNTDLTDDQHPYSTADFVKNTSQWTIINRSSVKKADAMVYRSGGAGHIIVYNSGDAWGSLNAYECKSCSAGCVYNLRTVSSAYKTIRRKGW
jgi:uncharacterized protein YraI